MACKIIALEGKDQAGKSSIVTRLIADLQKEGNEVAYYKFPNYNGEIGKLIKKVLDRETLLYPVPFHLLYEADRYEEETLIKLSASTCDYVIIDRWKLSNLAYGMARELHGSMIKAYEWLHEIQNGYLDADLNIIIDVDVKTALERKTDNLGHDLNETNLILQEGVRTAYRALAQICEHTEMVDGNRDFDTVYGEVLDLVLAL